MYRMAGRVPSFLLQKFSKAIHHHVLVLHEAVYIAVERDVGVLVPQDLGESFDIHTAFEGAGGERVPQRMKTPVRDM